MGTKRQRSNPVEFLTLPLEIRTIVYKKFFEDSFILRLSATNGKGADTLKYRLEHPTNIHLLATCKQIYREARQILIDSTQMMKTLMPCEWDENAWGQEVPDAARGNPGIIINEVLQSLKTIQATHHLSFAHLKPYTKLEKVTLHQILPAQVVGHPSLCGVDLDSVYRDTDIQAKFIKVFLTDNRWVTQLLEAPAPTVAAPATSSTLRTTPPPPTPSQTPPTTNSTTTNAITQITNTAPTTPPTLRSASPTVSFSISFLLHDRFPRGRPCEPGCNCVRPVHFLDIRRFNAKSVTVDALENKVIDRKNLARPEFLREMRRWGFCAMMLGTAVRNSSERRRGGGLGRGGNGLREGFNILIEDIGEQRSL